MNTEQVGVLVGRYMALVILLVAAVSLFWPSFGLWVELSWINELLMIVMFGMGLMLRFEDFRVVFRHPKYILIGCIAQFTIMPLLAYVLGNVFALGTGLLVGVILVGCCPGGTASNVMTYLAKGDVPLSVGMTMVNTLLAPVVTPLLVFLCLGERVEVDLWSMVKSILEVVIIPLALGFAITHFAGKRTEKVGAVLPLISVAAISLIVMSVVSHNSDRIMNTALVVFVVVILHNLLGYLFGYLVGVFTMASSEQRIAHSIEIGMQNSGLASTLAVLSFPSYAMAPVPGAIFSVWHNISGALLASYFRRQQDKREVESSLSSAGENES